MPVEELGEKQGTQEQQAQQAWLEELRQQKPEPRLGEVVVQPGAQDRVVVQDRVVPRERAVQAPVDLAQERAKLDGLAQARLSGRDLDRFRENMTHFETRSKTQKVTDDQVGRTYGEVSRLLDSNTSGFLSERDRTRLARQVLQNAADPTGINNGFHKTCNATTIENRTYSKYPEAAAKVVAEIALKGSYVTADGSTIAPSASSLRPDDESTWDSPADGQRNFASHVFQVTAVNVFWQRQTADLKGNPVAKGSIQYEQLSSRTKPDTGERLMDYSKQPPVELLDSKKNPIRQPFMRTFSIIDASNQITGRSESMLMENYYKPDDAPNSMIFKDEKEMRAKFVSAKAKGELPIILVVHTGNEPFKSDGRGAAGTWHVVCVNDFDDATGKASVDNEWGRSADHFGRNGVPISKLFKATVEPGTKMQQNMIRRSSEPIVID
jgi:hypothetical protein